MNIGMRQCETPRVQRRATRIKVQTLHEELAASRGSQVRLSRFTRLTARARGSRAITAGSPPEPRLSASGVVRVARLGRGVGGRRGSPCHGLGPWLGPCVTLAMLE